MVRKESELCWVFPGTLKSCAMWLPTVPHRQMIFCDLRDSKHKSSASPMDFDEGGKELCLHLGFPLEAPQPSGDLGHSFRAFPELRAVARAGGIYSHRKVLLLGQHQGGVKVMVNLDKGAPPRGGQGDRKGLQVTGFSHCLCIKYLGSCTW